MDNKLKRIQILEDALKDMVTAAEQRWRSQPTDSFEKRSLNKAKEALKNEP